MQAFPQKLSLFLAFLAAALASSAHELLRNSDFSLKEALPGAVKRSFESFGTEFAGKDFSRWWGVTKAAKVIFAGNRLTIQSRDKESAILGMRNYRLPRKALGHYAFKLTVAAKGAGKAVAGFYGYNKNKFASTVSCETPLVFDEQGQLRSALFYVDQIHKSITDLACFIRIDGKLQISKVSCMAVTPVLPTPSDEFKRLSEDEKISRLKQGRDWELAAAALGDESPNVRNVACYQLGNIGESAKPAMIKLSEMIHGDDYEPVRVHAARALCNMGEGAHGVIREILLGNDGSARLTMATTVRGMKRVPEALKDAVEWANPPVATFNTSSLADGNFEAAEGTNLVGWVVEFKDGAEGSYEIDPNVAYQGEQSLKITKTNGKGYVLLRSTMPVTVSTKDYEEPVTWRFFFKTADASSNTLLLPRFINGAGSMVNDSAQVNGGRGLMGQSMLRNTPPHVWSRRAAMYKPTALAMPLSPAIVFYGNPATVWIDAAQYPAVPFKIHGSGPTYPEARHSMPEANAIINEKAEATLKLQKEVNGKLSLVLNGKKTAPVFHAPSLGRSASDFHYMHSLGKVKLHNLPLNTRGSLRYPPFDIPVKLDKIDKQLIFDELEQSLRHAPEATYLLALNIKLPADFVSEHPDEAWMNAAGEKAYGNGVHVQGFGDLKGPDQFHWPSQYSEKGWQSAENVLRELLLELKAKPYAKAIAGIFVAGGHDGQFAMPYDDYSRPAKSAWREFLRQRYKTDEALAAAWNRPNLKIDEAGIPQSLKGCKELKGQFLLDPEKYQANVDYREFKEARIWQNAGRFAKLFKEVFGEDKFAMTYCMGGGWKKNFRAFYDCGFDAFVPQASYFNRSLGLSGGVNMVDASFLKHNKMVIAELDTRSWVRCRYTEVTEMAWGIPFSKRQFKSLVMKEAGRQLAHGHGYWFYDIGSNCFRHPAAMEVIAETAAAAGKITARAAEDDFTPPVALVYHQKSVFYDAPFDVYTGSWASEILNLMAYGLCRSGVPMTAYFMEDLLDGDDYKKHRIFIFMNAHLLTDRERDFINNRLKRDGKTLVWIHSSGILSEKKFAPAQTAALTGFNLKYDATPRDYRVDKCEFKDALSQGVPLNIGSGDIHRRYVDTGNSPDSKYLLPCFEIDDPAALLLGRFPDGKGALGVKKFDDWTSVFCAAPGGMDAVLLHNLAQAAGAYTVTRPGLACEVNGNFMSIHACVTGDYAIKLPKHVKVVRDALTDKVIARDTRELKLYFKAWESRWLIWE